MKDNLLKEAVDLGRKLGHVFLTTSDKNGLPHLTVASKINLTFNGKLAVAEWFCPGTVMNLDNNPRIGVIVWDEKNDTGYQMLGKKEELREIAILDGFAPESEETSPLPQVEREVVINVEKILEFKQAPHSDLEEH